MLINDNLILDSNLDNPTYWNLKKDYKKDGPIVTAIFNGPQSLGLIFETTENIKADTDYTLSIYVKGTKAFKLNYNYLMYGEDGNLPLNMYSKLCTPNIWHRISIPIKHSKNYSFKSIMVGSMINTDEEWELSFKHPKLEIGTEATQYIPSKNSLDPSNQAIFKAAGGYSKRCIHSHRIGGGVC